MRGSRGSDGHSYIGTPTTIVRVVAVGSCRGVRRRDYRSHAGWGAFWCAAHAGSRPTRWGREGRGVGAGATRLDYWGGGPSAVGFEVVFDGGRFSRVICVVALELSFGEGDTGDDRGDHRNADSSACAVVEGDLAERGRQQC